MTQVFVRKARASVVLLALILLSACSTHRTRTLTEGTGSVSHASSGGTVDSSEELTLEKWKNFQHSVLSGDGRKGDDLMRELLNSSELPPITAVVYDDAITAFAIPYNPAWGLRQLRLSPFWKDDSSTTITFGPLFGMEGGIGRDCTYSLLPSRTLTEAAHDSIENCNIVDDRKCTAGDTSLELRRYGMNDVLYLGEGSFGTTSAEIHGNNRNILFHCWHSALEPVLQSVQLK